MSRDTRDDKLKGVRRTGQRKMKKTPTCNSKGQSIVEFTLLLPLLIILVGGLTDLGVAFLVSIGVQNSVREGARIAVTTEDLIGDDIGVLGAVMDRIPAIGQFSSIVVTNTAPSDATCQAEVTVTASGNYNFIFLGIIGFTSIPISRSTTMRYEDRPLCT